MSPTWCTRLPLLQVLNRPLDGLAAAAGGLAAAVRGSPSVAARKDRKLCGAGQEGVKGRTVPWESPFGGSSSSPEVRSGVLKYVLASQLTCFL